MDNQEAIKMLTAKVECMQRETSGTDIDCNLRNCDECELCYAQGTTGEQRKALNMAISALQEQEAKTQLSAEGTTSDLISRQTVLESFRKICNICGKDKKYDGVMCRACYLGDAIDIVEELPSAQPEPQWISVSERLPEKYGNYLISIHGEDEPDIGTINPNDKRGWSLCDANGFHWASDKKLIVTAWMPLPEPYRAERKTDEKKNI